MAATNANPFEGFYKHLFNHSDSAVLVNDEAGRTLEANDKAASLLGFKRERLRTVSWTELFANSHRKLAQTILDSAFETGQAKAHARMIGADETEFDVAVATKRFELEGRMVVHSVVSQKTPPSAAQAPALAAPSPCAPDAGPDTSRLAELNMVFSVSPNGLALLDETQHVQVANPAFARFMERTVTQIVGMSVTDIEAELNQRAAQGQPPLSLTHWDEPSPDETLISPPHRRIRLAQPKTRTVKCQFRRLGAGDESDRAILSLQDITREDEVDQMKTRFLSAAAHELRNPMASISGFADLLTSTPQDSPVFSEVVGTIQNQARAMDFLINELLELTRMGALGRRDLELQRIETTEWVQDTVRQFRRQDDPRTATVSVRRSIPRITADTEKLTRALTNVLSNAFKYSGVGTDVSVELSAHGDSVHICVIDKGMGMSTQDVARLCDPFYRADAAKDIQGTGLGMALVLEILNAHGGDLNVQSELGTGTRVTISIPRYAPA
jgi:PAS domain S-box-containing protein